MKIMLFKHKNTVKVDMADLNAEAANLAAFLLSQYKLSASMTSKGLELKDVETYSLLTMVKKFVHHKNLSGTHGVNAENNVVKIYRFKGTAKKKEKHEKDTGHQNITQSWGL
jgi:hypothetical protein